MKLNPSCNGYFGYMIRGQYGPNYPIEKMNSKHGVQNRKFIHHPHFGPPPNS